MTDEKEDVSTEARPIKNIDAMIVAAQNPEVKVPHETPVEPKVENSDAPEAETLQVEAETLQEGDKSGDESDDKVDNKSDKVVNDSEKVDKEVAKESPKGDTDEYGNPVTGKKKLYTEEEVNQKIRERLKRGQYAEQQQQPVQLQPATPPNTPENNEEISFEDQLAEIVDKTITKKQQQAQELQWQNQQRQQQAEFEEKFSAGMSKYQDFKEVVSGKPLTDTMMLATRSMNNPAAFIYAASKTQAAELERISKISDPLTQAAEIGRLEEKMKKVRNAATHAKPIKAAKSDMVEGKEVKKQSIDSLIHAHGKTKFRR